MKKILDAGPGWKEYFHSGDRPGHFAIEHIEDSNHLLREAKIYSERPPGKDFRLARVVPQHIMNKAMREGWDRKDWKRWANNSDYKHLWVWDKRI